MLSRILKRLLSHQIDSPFWHIVCLFVCFAILFVKKILKLYVDLLSFLLNLSWVFCSFFSLIGKWKFISVYSSDLSKRRKCQNVYLVPPVLVLWVLIVSGKVSWVFYRTNHIIYKDKFTLTTTTHFFKTRNKEECSPRQMSSGMPSSNVRHFDNICSNSKTLRTQNLFGREDSPGNTII